MADLTVKQNDTGYPLNFAVKNADGTTKDLSGYSARLKIWAPGKPSVLLLSGACTISNPTAGLCYYTIAQTGFNLPGSYSFELELTKTGVIESTETYNLQINESG